MERKDLLKIISDKLGTSASIPLFEGNQGRLFKLKADEQSYLIKSANQDHWWSKSINRWSIRHEYKIYEKLENLDGIPKCYGLTKDGSLVLEYIDGESYRSKQFELDGNDQFFNSFLDLIKSMHDRGIAHGDLKRKDNFLVGKDLNPYLIDFGTALIKENQSGLLKNIIFNFLKKTDLNAWIKHKYRREYGNISDEDKVYYSPTLVEKFYRKFIKRL